MICKRRRPAAGFTLLELLLVAVIGAILAALAVPAYDEQLRRARRAQATSHLSLLQGRQIQFFLEHRRYASRLRSLGHGETPCIDAAGQPVDAASRRCSYRLDLTAGPLDFQLSATPVNAQRHDRRCGVLTLDATGRRGASGPAPVAECWR
jgi:type IV pilus assembly protein PilE